MHFQNGKQRPAGSKVNDSVCIELFKTDFYEQTNIHRVFFTLLLNRHMKEHAQPLRHCLK